MERFLRVGDVRKITGVGRSTIYQEVKTGEFPSPVAVSKNISGWVDSEVQFWIKERIYAARQSQHYDDK